MPRQSTNDETELQEQPRVDGVDEEEIDDLPDWGKMEVCLYFQLIAGMLIKVLKKCGLSDPLQNICFWSKTLNLIGCYGVATKRINWQKHGN